MPPVMSLTSPALPPPNAAQLMSKEEGEAVREEQRRRMEVRLQQAETARAARLAEASGRAGEQVKKAAQISQLSKMLQVCVCVCVCVCGGGGGGGQGTDAGGI